ncbi:EAL domain-containing protein [Novosphingobium sp. KCTC 2891]|uniref:putative bifunctional diguanylate cyclase/phosphodiesterase n=1 Tax=Novosphingobium sp. KCTC 2891 TaxID=2989730 RepID=UPI0022232C53|nr:EAL domain-containing protein [Novosphingobium sp. KCTC 2891]MCW1381563.1 EAL domain-containing protein [Novosphingobium sp. KCTC 2891]
MAFRNLLRNRGESAGGDSGTASGAHALSDPVRRLDVLDAVERSGRVFLWGTDSAGCLTYLSPGAAPRLGAQVETILGRPFASLFEVDPDNPGERSDRPLQFQMTSRGRLADLILRFNPAASDAGTAPTWWALSGEAALAEDGTFLGHRGHARDVTTEYVRRIEDARLAEFDTLTGLGNRHRLNRRLDQVLAAYRASGRACALLMLDLDRFKHVNDTLGHQAGDELLRQVAQRLRKVIGERGEIGRLGGDEFQVIIPDLDDRGKLGELAERLIGHISQPYLVGADRAVIGTSVGIAVAPFDGQERDQVVHAADLALYAAKNGGRGQFRFFSSDLRDEKEERRLIEEALRAALGSEELTLSYQPVVRTDDHTVVGFEALMRWENADRGAIDPSLFIPIAEETGLIAPLGAWALRRACADAMAWPKSVRVAVNVSAVQFADTAFPAMVEEALADSGLAPDRLELELTESIFLGDDDATSAAFDALKAIGVRLVLDDFGTGYSSLSYLRAAPFDKLKVDRSFVEVCTLQDNSSAKIIAAIIGLAEALGMETTVEGVEAFDQFHLVCAKGARFVQGFLYSPPLPHEETLARIAADAFRIEPTGPERHRPERRSVYRRVGLIHEDHRYEAVMKDLSATGARIDGLVGVPVGTGVVLDLGAGQLAVGHVARSEDATIGIEFETPLVPDGAGGLVTRHRVSPSALAAAARIVPTTAPRFMEVKPGSSTASAARA